MKRCRVKRPNFQIKNKMNKENKTSDKHEHGNDFIADVMQRFLIYADDYITWNKQKNDWNHSDEFTGTYLDAHEYARSKYGKRYTLNVA